MFRPLGGMIARHVSVYYKCPRSFFQRYFLRGIHFLRKKRKKMQPGQICCTSFGAGKRREHAGYQGYIIAFPRGFVKGWNNLICGVFRSIPFRPWNVRVPLHNLFRHSNHAPIRGGFYGETVLHGGNDAGKNSAGNYSNRKFGRANSAMERGGGKSGPVQPNRRESIHERSDPETEKHH